MIGKGRRIGFAVIAGFIASFCLVAGYYLDNFDNLNLLSASFYAQLSGMTVLCSAVFYGLWLLMARSGRPHRARGWSKEPARRKDPRIPFWGNAAAMLLCWFPCFLSVFPGAFSYDANQEWLQVHEHAITSHHPVLHVLLTGGLVEGFYSLTGSYNVGIAAYTVLQMTALACIFAYSIFLQRQIGLKWGWQIFSLIFFCLSPVIQLFSVCTTKDVLFFGAMLLLVEYLILLYRGPTAFFQKKSRLAGFGVSIFLTMVLRNNGLYIVLAMMVVLAFSLKKYEIRKHCPRLLFVVIGVVLVYVMYTGPFYRLMNVENGGMGEMLSVPLQQLARVYTYDKDTLAQEDIELLYTLVDEEALETYRATVADFVKSGFHEEAFTENPTVYIGLWIRWGLQHPLTYINSFLINTVDIWYPFAVIDGYRFGGTEAYPDGRSSYFDYKVAEPGEEIVLFEAAHTYYERISLDASVQKMPWTALFLSPGLYFLVFMFIFFYLWCFRKYRLLLPLLIVWLNMFTVLLGPIALVRYVLIVFYGFPLFLGLIGCGNRESCLKNNIVSAGKSGESVSLLADGELYHERPLLMI